MIRRLFLDHPASVGENYAEHARVAVGFGFTLIGGGLAALVHAIVPGWFQTTGSRTVIALHHRLVAKRAAARADQMQTLTVEYVI